MSVTVFSPVIPLSVSGPRNSAAERVITGSTRAPAFRSARAISAALYAAMLPDTASAITGGRSGGGGSGAPGGGRLDVVTRETVARNSALWNRRGGVS